MGLLWLLDSKGLTGFLFSFFYSGYESISWNQISEGQIFALPHYQLWDISFFIGKMVKIGIMAVPINMAIRRIE